MWVGGCSHCWEGVGRQEEGQNGVGITRCCREMAEQHGGGRRCYCCCRRRQTSAHTHAFKHTQTLWEKTQTTAVAETADTNTGRTHSPCPPTSAVSAPNGGFHGAATGRCGSGSCCRAGSTQWHCRTARRAGSKPTEAACNACTLGRGTGTAPGGRAAVSARRCTPIVRVSAASGGDRHCTAVSTANAGNTSRHGAEAGTFDGGTTLGEIYLT